MMGDPLGAIIIDRSVGLPAFLSRFYLLEFNSFPVGHFSHFGASYSGFLHFSVPTESLHSWSSYLRFMGTSLLGLEEVCS